MYIRYGWLAFINLIFTGIAYVFAPIYVLFSNEQGYLPKWLIWFQTQDNSLDEGWRGSYFGDPVNPPPVGYQRYKYRIKWLWRNPAYGFCYWPLGIEVKADDWIIDTYQTDANGGRTLLKAHTKDNKYFAYTTSADLKFGWKIWAYFQGMDKDGKPVWSDKPWGPEMRTSLCFTPGKISNWFK